LAARKVSDERVHAHGTSKELPEEVQIELDYLNEIRDSVVDLPLVGAEVIAALARIELKLEEIRVCVCKKDKGK
jgi:hypothetical protein